MTPTCADARISLGAYVLGALDHRERAEVESHLAGCAGCRDELAGLAPLPGLLGRLSIDEAVSGPPPVDDAMLDRLLRAASRDRRAATHRRVLAAAAAVVVLGGGSVAGVAAWRSAHATHWEQVSASAGGVHMAVDLQPVSTGTEMQLWLTGVERGERCRLIAVSDSGQRDVAGSWAVDYEGTATIQGTTSITREHLRRLVIRTYDGATLVAAAVPAG